MVYVFYFSPTGGTLKTLKNIVDGMGVTPEYVDLSVPENREREYHVSAVQRAHLHAPVHDGLGLHHAHSHEAQTGETELYRVRYLRSRLPGPCHPHGQEGR